jgi:hypothetical protein
MALLALGEVASAEDAEVQRILDEALSCAEPPLRFQALLACPRLLARGSEGVLRAATADTDGHVRALAWRLLEQMSAEDGEEVDLDAVLAQAQGALVDESIEVRLAAAILLKRLGSPAGAEAIEDALNGRLPLNPEDEQAAIEAAGQLGLHRACPGLKRRARGGWHAAYPFAWHARVALARLGDEAAQKSILRGLQSWSRDTRTLAVAAAGQARLIRARAALEAMRGDPTRAEPDSVREALDLLAAASKP